MPASYETRARGASLAERARQMTKPVFAAWVRTALTEDDKDALELEYRRKFIARMNRDEQTEKVRASFPRKAVRDDVPTLESIEARFGVHHAWDISSADQREQAEIDALLSLPSPDAARHAQELRDLGIDLEPDTSESPEELIARVEQRAAADAKDEVADLLAAVNAPDVPPAQEERDVLAKEITRLENLPKSRRY
jgi:hypothetical protein